MCLCSDATEKRCRGIFPQTELTEVLCPAGAVTTHTGGDEITGVVGATRRDGDDMGLFPADRKEFGLTALTDTLLLRTEVAFPEGLAFGLRNRTTTGSGLCVAVLITEGVREFHDEVVADCGVAHWCPGGNLFVGVAEPLLERIGCGRSGGGEKMKEQSDDVELVDADLGSGLGRRANRGQRRDERVKQCSQRRLIRLRERHIVWCARHRLLVALEDLAELILVPVDGLHGCGDVAIEIEGDAIGGQVHPFALRAGHETGEGGQETVAEVCAAHELADGMFGVLEVLRTGDAGTVLETREHGLALCQGHTVLNDGHRNLVAVEPFLLGLRTFGQAETVGETGGVSALPEDQFCAPFVVLQRRIFREGLDGVQTVLAVHTLVADTPRICGGIVGLFGVEAVEGQEGNGPVPHDGVDEPTVLGLFPAAGALVTGGEFQFVVLQEVTVDGLDRAGSGGAPCLETGEGCGGHHVRRWAWCLTVVGGGFGATLFLDSCVLHTALLALCGFIKFINGIFAGVPAAAVVFHFRVCQNGERLLSKSALLTTLSGRRPFQTEYQNFLYFLFGLCGFSQQTD